MGSFSIPLSGLTAAQSQLQSVSNNLANLNTDGYKDQNVLFADLFAQTGAVNGAGNPMQTGLGVTAAATVSNFTDGHVNSTGIPSNMALAGQGFFVLSNSDGTTSYSRAGDFTENSSGYLVSPNGEKVLGYPATAGVVNTTAPLQPLQVGKGVTTPAVATSSITISANLDSNTAVGGSGPVSSLPIYDSLGSPHTLSINYTKTAANVWTYTVTIPTADISGGTGNTTIGSGTLNFNGSGNLTSITGATAMSIPSFANGATGPQALSGPFGTTTNPTITQTYSASTTSSTDQDGRASGTLQAYSIQADGTIQGTFSSGKTLTIGQVAIATFANNQGLGAVGNNKFNETSASGSAVVGLANQGGRGSITGGAVEQSNVDISAEFSKLIVAQQAYSANAKTITTFNQVSQATLQMLQ